MARTEKKKCVLYTRTLYYKRSDIFFSSFIFTVSRLAPYGVSIKYLQMHTRCTLMREHDNNDNNIMGLPSVIIIWRKKTNLNIDSSADVKPAADRFKVYTYLLSIYRYIYYIRYHTYNTYNIITIRVLLLLLVRIHTGTDTCTYVIYYIIVLICLTYYTLYVRTHIAII